MPLILYPLLTILMCLLSFYLFLRDEERIPSDSGESRVTGQMNMSAIIYSVVMILLTLVLSVLIPRMFPDIGNMAVLKRVLLLAVIWPIAYIDFHTYRIPNAFVVYGLGVRACVLVFELLFNDGALVYTLISEGIAAGALFIASMLCAVCMKGSIGFGDIKLFLVMGLFLGMEVCWSAVFSALVISLVVALFLLATKKKSRKDTMPFGPAIVMGTYLSVCLTGM